MLKYLLSAALLVACAGSDFNDGDEVELGQTQEALQENCAGNNHYGTDLNVWGNRQCLVNNSSYACSFPAQRYAFTVGLRNNWAGFENTQVTAAGNNAATFFHTTFPSWESNTFKWKFVSSFTNGNTGAVLIDNIIMAGHADPNSSVVRAENFYHMSCVSSTPLTESFAMQSAQKCNQWAVSLDYDLVRTWTGNPTDGTACNQACQTATKNILLKIFFVAAGAGLSDNLQSLTIGNAYVNKSIVQSNSYTPPGGASDFSWITNHVLPIKDDGNNILTCF